MITVGIATKNTGNDQVAIDFKPNECPFCHRTIVPIDTGGYLTPEFVELLFRCSNEECQKGFYAYYEEVIMQSVKHSPKRYVFKKTSIGTFISRVFDDRINQISPLFSVIYNQGLESEKMRLDQISGMGFRKSIEFLIKDYLIFKIPLKVDEIKKKSLGDCIREFVENEKIREISKRAVWLGNDEVHYVRKWEEKDIEDLKKLIDITIHWIEMELRTDEYLKEMS